MPGYDVHAGQQIGETVRYSGSPVAMSFGEAGQTKGSLLVEIDERGLTTVEHVAAPVHRELALGGRDHLVGGRVVGGRRRHRNPTAG